MFFIGQALAESGQTFFPEMPANLTEEYGLFCEEINCGGENMSAAAT